MITNTSIPYSTLDLISWGRYFFTFFFGYILPLCFRAVWDPELRFFGGAKHVNFGCFMVFCPQLQVDPVQSLPPLVHKPKLTSLSFKVDVKAPLDK